MLRIRNSYSVIRNRSAAKVEHQPGMIRLPVRLSRRPALGGEDGGLKVLLFSTLYHPEMGYYLIPKALVVRVVEES